MAKGRKHGLFDRERLLGSVSRAHGHSAAAADLPDLGEDDVWSTMTADDSGGGEEASGEEGWYGDFAWKSSGSGSSGGGGDSGSRNRERRQVGGLSLAFDGSGGGAPPRVVHQCRNAGSSWGGGGGGRRHLQAAASAPISVPGWRGGGHRVDPVESPPGYGEFDDGGEWVPPHEYLAREYSTASSGRSAAGSVVEGVSRTLKGRDLRRLRDAVWSQTGFYG